MTEIQLTAIAISIVVLLGFAFIGYKALCKMADTAEDWEDVIDDDHHLGV